MPGEPWVGAREGWVVGGRVVNAPAAGAAATHPVPSAATVRVSVQGAFPTDTATRAEQVLGAALRDGGWWPDAVREARVRLSAHRDPAVHFPVVAQVNLELTGVPVRAQVRAATSREAVDLLRSRMCHQLERATRGPGALGDWRHPRPAGRWVACFPRPARACRIVRDKPCTLARLDVDEAVHQLECRDYDFHLFAEAGTGQDSVVFRAGHGGYRLAQVRPDPARLTPYSAPVSCFGRPAPGLDVATAVELFGMTEAPFLFFALADGDRGAVVYRRFDGNYGLLRHGDPATTDAADATADGIPGPRERR